MQATPRVTRGAGLVKALVGITVLVVDEDSEVRELLEAVLVYGGALVTLASASDAVAVLRRTRADVVVIGVTPSGREAFRLARELRDLSGSATPVAVVAVADRDIPDSALREGFEACVRKPVDPRDFCRVIAGLARKA